MVVFCCCCCHWTLDSGRLCAGKSLLTFPSGSPPPSQRWRPCSCCTQPSTLHHTQCLDSFHSSCCMAIVGPGRLGGVHTNNTQPAHAGQSRLTQAATSITRTSRHVGLSQNILLVIWVCHRIYYLSSGFVTEHIACHQGLSLNILLVIWVCH